MESANRIIALLLGLLVVLFIVAAVLGKVGFLKIKGPITNSPVGQALGLRQPSPTPGSKTAKKETEFVTITKKTTSEETVNNVKTVNPTGVAGVSTSEKTTKGGQPVSQIPATGTPAIIYPLTLAMFSAGVYLRRRN